MIIQMVEIIVFVFILNQVLIIKFSKSINYNIHFLYFDSNF